jgi:periplasmic divalent cation tolerance protein
VGASEKTPRGRKRTGGGSSDEKIVVFVTVPDVEDAERIGRSLVEGRLAACVNIVPQIRSLFRWEGKVADESETLLIVKTRRALFDSLRAHVKQMHPYDIPEVIALPVVAGHQPYLRWIDEATEP